jgi:hypothetical protein
MASQVCSPISERIVHCSQLFEVDVQRQEIGVPGFRALLADGEEMLRAGYPGGRMELTCIQVRLAVEGQTELALLLLGREHPAPAH